MPLRAIGPIFGQVYGDGDPGVVALHGWGRRGADFDRVLDGLDAVAFDLPGFGATPPPEVACGAAGYAQVVIEALTALGSRLVPTWFRGWSSPVFRSFVPM
jgi:pimeloyl-ACP methyl ester carboxylesterase